MKFNSTNFLDPISIVAKATLLSILSWHLKKQYKALKDEANEIYLSKVELLWTI